MKLATLWISGRIHNLGTLCLSSWLDHGFDVDLYHLGPVENVPAGVRLRPAAEVLPADLIPRLKPLRYTERANIQSTLSYSDLFRMKLMELGRGLWLDCDVLLFRPFDIDPGKPFFAWEDRHRIGASVFYLPEDCEMIRDYNRVYDHPDLMPHWLGFRRRVLKPALWRLQGKPFSPRDLGITIYGNDAFSRLIKKHKLTQYALGTKPFYCWNGKQTTRFFDPTDKWRLEDDPDVTGLHVHCKTRPNHRPTPDSLFGRMLKRHADRLPADMTWQS